MNAKDCRKSSLDRFRSNSWNRVYILQSLPIGDIKPAPFVEDSRSLLEHVSKKVCHHFSSNNGLISQPGKTHAGDAVLAEWVHFTGNVAPVSDDVEEYIATHGLHIPFRDILFGSVTELPYLISRQRKRHVY